MRRTLASAVVLVVALGACGSTTDRASKGSTAKVSTVALVAGAAERASAAKTARVSMHMSIPVLGSTKDLSVDGLVDFKSNAVEMTMDMGALGAGTGSIEMRIVDGALYMNMGEMLKATGAVPPGLAGKSWVKIDMGKLGASAANPAGQQQNPADLLDALRGAGDVEKLGTDDIRGTQATHYRVHVDLQKAIAGLDKKLADQVRQSMAIFKQADMPIDVWIGGDGLPRRESIDLATGKNAMAITMDFFDFGVNVDIVAPPAEDTADFSQFTDSFGPGASAN